LFSTRSRRAFLCGKGLRAPGEGAGRLCWCLLGASGEGSSPEGSSSCRNTSPQVKFEFIQPRAPPALQERA